MTRVLVLAAHPDDEVLGMGGTIAVHTDRGDEVRIVVVTDGSSTQYPGDAETRARKEEEAVRAAAELGVTDYVHLDLPDMRLDTLAARRRQPRSSRSTSATSRPRSSTRRIRTSIATTACSSTRSQSRHGRRPEQPVRRVLTYAPTSSTEWTPAALNWFVPNWFVDISATLERKVAAFAHYETERRDYPHPRSERAIRAAASVLRIELRMRVRGAVRCSPRAGCRTRSPRRPRGRRP